MKIRTILAGAGIAVALVAGAGSEPAYACSLLQDATIEDVLAIQANDTGNLDHHLIEEYGHPIASIVERLTYAAAPGTERISRRSVAAVTRSWGDPPRGTADRFSGGAVIDDSDSCGPETGPPKGAYRYAIEFADGGTRALIVPRDEAGLATAAAQSSLEETAGPVRIHADSAALLAAPPLPAPESPNPWFGPLGALLAALAVMGAVFGTARGR